MKNNSAVHFAGRIGTRREADESQITGGKRKNLLPTTGASGS